VPYWKTRSAGLGCLLEAARILSSMMAVVRELKGFGGEGKQVLSRKGSNFREARKKYGAE
jgi:hypothetical protein